jgi:uracil-DNA glycosylase
MTTSNAFHDQYLKAMDIEIWVPRRPLAGVTNNAVNVSTIKSPSPTMPEDMAHNSSPIVESLTMNERLPAQNNQTPQSDTALVEANSEVAEINERSEYDELATSETLKTAASPLDTAENLAEVATVNTVSNVSAPENDSKIDLDWETLPNQIAQCTACILHQNRTQTVVGVGNRHADLIFIGEAPGAEEDAQGEPFVGRAGQLLTAMLYAIDLKREEVYIANVVKCRPPGNRDPEPNELACCDAFLQRQIALIQPKLIVAVGRIAAHHLLATETSVGKLRGQCFQYGEHKIPLIVTYHPAYLLRRPTEKRHSWQDLQFIQKTLSELNR